MRRQDALTSGQLAFRPCRGNFTSHRQRHNVLDVGSFEHFAPLLDACQDYARFSGCRFHGLSFEAQSLEPLRDTLAVDDLILSTSSVDSLDRVGPRLLAELHAAPAVLEFTQRLQCREPDLCNDLNRAVDIMMAEGVRNSLCVTCKQLGLWPPTPTPSGVDANDCFYYDLQADVPVVAQRLHNDGKRRARVLRSTGGVDLEHRLASAASFLVDFAFEAGISLPRMNPKHEAFLNDFAASVGAWEQAAAARKDELLQQCELEENVADWTAADISEAADMMRLDITNWLSRRLQLRQTLKIADRS